MSEPKEPPHLALFIDIVDPDGWETISPADMPDEGRNDTYVDGPFLPIAESKRVIRDELRLLGNLALISRSNGFAKALKTSRRRVLEQQYSGDLNEVAKNTAAKEGRIHDESKSILRRITGHSAFIGRLQDQVENETDQQAEEDLRRRIDTAEEWFEAVWHRYYIHYAGQNGSQHRASDSNSLISAEPSPVWVKHAGEVTELEHQQIRLRAEIDERYKSLPSDEQSLGTVDLNDPYAVERALEDIKSSALRASARALAVAIASRAGLPQN